MEFTEIKGIDIPVSRVGLGTWAIGGSFWGGSDEASAIRTILVALDQGINFVDTAPVYGYGVSEEIVGKAVREYGRRKGIVLATKAGLDWTDGTIGRNASPERLKQEVEDSLRRLRTDYIDLYQIHWPDSRTPIEASAEVMVRLLDEGKIRAIGVSNFSPKQMEQFRSVAPIHTAQPPYNVFEREMEIDVLPYCIEHNISVLAYGALCRGLLTGRIGLESQFGEDDIRRFDPKFQTPRLNDYLAAVTDLDKLARSRFARRVLELAVRFILDSIPGAVALWGARKPEQLTSLPGVFGWNLDAKDLDEINGIVDSHVSQPIGPAFFAPPE